MVAASPLLAATAALFELANTHQRRGDARVERELFGVERHVLELVLIDLLPVGESLLESQRSLFDARRLLADRADIVVAAPLLLELIDTAHHVSLGRLERT